MELRIENGLIYNEIGNIVAVMADNATKEDERAIMLGAEATPIIEDFVENLKSGKFKARSTSKTLEAIIEKYKI